MIRLGPAAGSIHKVGALAQGLPACNGWTFWHSETEGRLEPIDTLRAAFRAALENRAGDQAESSEIVTPALCLPSP